MQSFSVYYTTKVLKIMSDKSISALLRASDKAATDNVQHFVITVNGDGGFEVHGSLILLMVWCLIEKSIIN